MAVDRFGFSSSIVAGEGAADAVRAMTGGDGFDVVFDATGYGPSMEKAFGFVAHGGALVLVSVVKDDIRFSDPEFHKREMTLMGSRNATVEDFETVVQAMRDGLVPSEALHTHSAELADLPKVLSAWMEPSAGVIKAIVTC
jgi:threonine dehydrogenase-like Zn-dependent dehydrogenase